MKRNLIDYITDLCYGVTKYPFGGIRPKVVFPGQIVGLIKPVSIQKKQSQIPKSKFK